MSRVVVIGAGIGGCLAALAANRRDPGTEVTLVSTAPERYRHEPGTIDVLGYTEDSERPVERPLIETRSLPEDHPYNRVGEHGVRDALDFFDDVFENDESLPYRSGRNKNTLVPTAQGSVRPTSRYPEGMRAGLVSDQRRMHVVGFEQITHLNAGHFADRLDAAVPYNVDSTTVRFPTEPSEHPPFEEFSQALDENRDTDEGVPLRDALADAVRPELDIEPRVGFPAVLGSDEHEAVRRDLESLLQADVFEVPVGEPNLPGVRLGNRLFELVADAGIERVEGTVTDFASSGDVVQSVTVDPDAEDGEQVTIDGGVFILSSGGVATGGLVGTGDDIVEPVFGCPTTISGGPVERSDSDPHGDHPFARAGVEVTGELRPAENGEVLYGNVFAAGTVIGGHNFVRERSRGGVAVVTGYVAGRRAVDQL